MYSVIETLAEEFLDWNIDSAGRNWEKFVEDVKDNVYKFSKNKDKSQYLRIVIKAVENASEKHAKECPQPPNTCDTSKGFEKSKFFLNQEYQGIVGDDNIEEFGIEETIILNQKLDKIISDLEDLKIDNDTLQKGQVMIVEGFMQEFQELKDLYSLGHKNWRQNLVGKFGEMVVSGIVSETISKEVMEILKGLGKEYPLQLIFNP